MSSEVGCTTDELLASISSRHYREVNVRPMVMFQLELAVRWFIPEDWTVARRNVQGSDGQIGLAAVGYCDQCFVIPLGESDRY
jgi:hypothetical protein